MHARGLFRQCAAYAMLPTWLGLNLVHSRYMLCFAVHCCAQVRLVGSNSLAAAVAEVTHLPLGGFCCSYVAPATPGLYVLEVVTTGGKHVGGSPFSVRVRTFVLGRRARLAAASLFMVGFQARTCLLRHQPWVASRTVLPLPRNRNPGDQPCMS